ncbi:MAG: hypothetical protein CVV63_03935 [Tenericutes bacterium HGW-Tenericutes-8]|nr:MAG: hypothetical protein CVV63_03935 [Tenericutes bacterium HGW-Tenericutes-8]
MDYIQIVEEKLKGHEKRITHVKGVLARALELQALYGGSTDVINTSALLHDLCKYDTIESQLSMIKDKALVKQYNSATVMYHALAAAYYVKDVLKIEDEGVFEAISYHVWGKIHMRLETMIIVVADYCEPNRSFKEASIVYELAKKDLVAAYVLSLEFVTNYLYEQGITPHQEQLDAIAFYKENK